MKRRMFEADGVMWWVFDVMPSQSLMIDPALASGWLCFESKSELRRLAPIPDDWETASHVDLVRHLSTAVMSMRKTGSRWE
jgi:hypothetical protein